MLITNGKIYTMAGQIYENGSILIENGKIKALGARVEVPPGVKVIDAEEGWVLPGFIEAHSHLGINEANMGFEGNDNNEATNPITPQMRALDGINPQDAAFEKVVAGCPVPVLIAGGPRCETDLDTLKMIYGAMQGGARGIVMGRNVWHYWQRLTASFIRVWM